MSIYRLFPLPHIDDLKPKPTLYDFSRFAGHHQNESFALIGENEVLKTSLLLQAALSFVKDGKEKIIFIRPDLFRRRPLPIHGMLRCSAVVTDCIKMEYISEPLGLIKYLCELHMNDELPGAVIVEDLHYYVSLHQEHNRDAAVYNLFALLEDSTQYVSEKRGRPCHRLISLTKPPSSKGFMKKYFKEVWQLSFSDNGSQIYLTDDHVPAYRIIFNVSEGKDDDDDKIVFDTVLRLPGDNLSKAIENS